MPFGREEIEAIRQIVAEEIQDLLRREFAELKAHLAAHPGVRRAVKPQRAGRSMNAGEQNSETAKAGTRNATAQRRSSGGRAAIEPAVPAVPVPGGAEIHRMARALARAQHELAQELEMNLRTLNEVILHSQDIARRIRTILGNGDTR